LQLGSGRVRSRSYFLAEKRGYPIEYAGRKAALP